MKEFTLATFNVRGLKKLYKQGCLSSDIENYKIDVCCLQETKIKEGIDEDIKGCRIISLPSVSHHYGNGFIVSKRWKGNIHKYWKVNERMAILQLKLKSKEKKEVTINIINVYAPHTQRVKEDAKELDDLYECLNELVSNFKNVSSSITLIGGDFNAKVGKRTHAEACLGNYSRGRRNTSGQCLIDFCDTQQLLITNSCFQHPAKHQTTWEQQRKNRENNTIVTIYNQIDYIMIPSNRRHLLSQSRSYKGTLVDSDHRLVICRLSIELYKFYKKVNKVSIVKYNTRSLISDKQHRNYYANSLNEKLKIGNR